MERAKLLSELNERERARLSSLSAEKGDCASPVFGDGDINADIVFIGEAPGANEVQMGKPFVGKAGLQLDHMLTVCEIERKALYVTNAVKYRTWTCTEMGSGKRAKNRTPSLAEIRDSAPMLKEELAIISPKVIVTLGNTPLKALEYISGDNLGSIGELHGKPYLLKGMSAVLFPLYHPASGIYNRSLLPVMEDDLHKLKELQIMED